MTLTYVRTRYKLKGLVDVREKLHCDPAIGVTEARVVILTPQFEDENRIVFAEK